MATAKSASPKSQSTVQGPLPLAVLRTAAANNGLLRLAFTQGNAGVSSAQMIMLLQQALAAAGLQLPKDVKLGLSGLQVVLAGGAVASDISDGAEILQTAGDISTVAAGIAQIFNMLGLLDNMSTDTISLGANATMVVSSYGANVMADIGCILSAISLVGDICVLGKEANALATSNAQRAIYNYLTATIVPQMMDAANLVRQYNQGALNVFDLIGQVALRDPTQFPTLFPGLACFLPQSIWTENAVATARATGYFGLVGSTSTVTESETFIEVLASKKAVEDAIIEKYLTLPMIPFESFETVAPVISLQAASVLALILQSAGGGDISVGFNFNAVAALQQLKITPSKLGDDWLFKGLQRNEKDIEDWASHLPYPPLTLPFIQPVVSGVSIGGLSYSSPLQKVQNQKAAELVALQKLMQHYDEIGDIDSLMKIPEAVAMLNRWANFYVEPQFYTASMHAADLAAYNQNVSSLQTILKNAQGNPNDNAIGVTVRAELAQLPRPNTIGEIINMKLTGRSITTQSWFSITMSTDPATAEGSKFWNYVYANYSIDLSDYWKILSTVSSMQKANLFSDNATVQGFTGSLAAIETLFQSAYSFVLCKQLNIRARTLLAQGLKMNPNTLKSRYDSQGNLIFYSSKAG